jgi:hypothetical protein
MLSLAMLYALGAGIAGLPRHPAAAHPAEVSSAERHIPVLPTVVVRPDDAGEPGQRLATTLLPTVVVHPTVDEIATIRALDARTGTAVAVYTLGGLAPKSGLDMPYYSFGKSAYRLRKE